MCNAIPHKILNVHLLPVTLARERIAIGLAENLSLSMGPLRLCRINYWSAIKFFSRG